MYQAKTKQTDKNVLEFLEDIAKERKKKILINYLHYLKR